MQKTGSVMVGVLSKFHNLEDGLLHAHFNYKL